MGDKKGFIIAIVVLSVIILGLGGYIAYDIMQDKKNAEEEQKTIIQNMSVDLTSFFEVENTLDSFDKAFNNPKSLYVGYPYKETRLLASKFNLGAAVYASMIKDMAGTGGSIQYVPETRVKSNFYKIFGSNLTYEATRDVNSGEIYKVAYFDGAQPIRYDYIAPSELDVYYSRYLAVNEKITLKSETLTVRRKLFFVEYIKDQGNNAIKAKIYKTHSKNQLLGEIALKEGEINTDELISKYSSSLLEYDYVFKEEKNGDYSFFKIEPVK